MAKNSKPILSVLIEEDKRTKFADLARRHSLSMGHLVNKAIDRMLENDSIDIYGESTPTSAGNYVDSSVGGMNRSDIEELIKSSIVSTDIERLVKFYVDNHSSSVVSIDDVKQMIAASISDIPTLETIKAEINSSIVPIENSIVKLETYTRSQFAGVNDELIPPSSREEVPTENQPLVKTPTTTSKEKADGDGNTKTWCGFFEMVGMTALTATEAQKKESIDIRTQQSDRGIQAAKEQGLGDWIVKRAGREFMRVDTTPEPTLPLFPN